MKYTQSVDDLSLRNPHTWSTVIVSKYRVTLDRRMLETGFVKLTKIYIYIYIYRVSQEERT